MTLNQDFKGTPLFRDLRIGNFRLNRISNRIGGWSFTASMLNFCWLPYKKLKKYCVIATRLLAVVYMLQLQVHELITLNINPSSNAETIKICRQTVSVVYGTTANMAGAAIQNFRIGPSLSNRIGTSDSNLNRISKPRRSLIIFHTLFNLTNHRRKLMRAFSRRCFTTEPVHGLPEGFKIILQSPLLTHSSSTLEPAIWPRAHTLQTDGTVMTTTESILHLRRNTNMMFA